MSKHDITDLINGTSLYKLGPNTMLLKGRINRWDLLKLKNWILTIKNDEISGAVLLIDSVGGLTDLSILVDMLQVPISTYVVGEAQSFAAMLFLAGSSKGMMPGTALMLHKARWAEKKESEEVARDEDIMTSHNYKVVSILSSLVPAEIKEDVINAVIGHEDVFFNSEYLWEVGAVDSIEYVEAEELGLEGDHKVWYTKKYIEEK